MKINLTHKYLTMLKEMIQDDPHIVVEVERAILLFNKNVSDSRLDVHPLRGKLKGKYSFSVTSDIRIIFTYIGKNHIRFLAVGPHQVVYPGYSKNK